MSCIETSADTEMDPFYHGADYIADWLAAVRRAQEAAGARVVNLYSGHGTYSTLGLAHTDTRVRQRILSQWLKPMVDTAHALKAGLGFFCHAFPQSVLADPERYEQEFLTLADNLAEIAGYNRSLGSREYLGVEQMYSPHQVPWTIAQSRRLLREVFARGAAPFYITIDVGHQSGQHRYRRPTRQALEEALLSIRRSGLAPQTWIGPDPIVERLCRVAADGAGSRHLDEIEAELSRYAQLYAEPADSDPYEWLRALAGWSPIVHLQQTDGSSSTHQPFNDETNRSGIIEAHKVLSAIDAHYRSATPDADMPSRVSDIYLTIEVFAATADTPEQVRSKLRQSVEYWRRYIPSDGETLKTLLSCG